MDRTPEWHGAGATHVGFVRPTNQDAFLISDEPGLWIVADGMGGHAGGDVASQKTIEAIRGYVAERAGLGLSDRTEEIPSFLQSAVGYANETVRAHAEANPEFTGMGTTVVLLFLPVPASPLAWVAHAGDSRAYLMRDLRMTVLTRDHTVLEEHISQGLLPRSTPASHPLGHALTRGVGVSPTIEADISMIKLQPMDEMRSQPPAHKCQALIDEANVRGGLDNTTVVLVARSEEAR